MAPSQTEYFDAQVAAGVEDYYAGRGESPGRWRGSGITSLGLVAGDRVGRTGFLALMRGLSPVDGAVLRAMGGRSTVAGLDLTFSAPKTVSVLFAIADDARVFVRPASTFGVRLQARIAACGPPPAALLVLE